MARRAEEEKYSLESIDRMVAVLEALERADEQSLEQVARQSGLSESTALRYLMSLSKHGMVERSEVSGAFRLGLRLFRLGALAVDRRDIVRISRPIMERLLQSFGESVNLATRQQNTIVLISVLDSPNPVRKGARAGETDSWHATSLGKALLAAMPPPEVDAVLSSVVFSSFTPNTITSTELLTRDLVGVKARSYAIDDEESVEGLRCVGAAILGHDGRPAYAMSVSGPKSRMSYTRIQEIGDALASSAAELARSLGGH